MGLKPTPTCAEYFMDIPKHIAIIMDGNGRWAKLKGLPKIMGHRQGVESVRRVIKACLKFSVKHLTLYTFSTENWSRPKEEVNALFQLLEDFLDKEFELFRENNVRLVVIGERERINERVRKKIEQFERDTLDNNALIVNVALSYGGRQEILNAVRFLASEVRDGRIELREIDEGVFSKALYTKNQPDPDLLIRTSGEMRISNFLLWQLSYTEIYVTEKLWPDFGEADLLEAIEEYGRRGRRFGK